MSLLTKKKVVAVKTETTVGTAISLSGSDAAFNFFDVSIQPNAEFIARPGQGAFGQRYGMVGPASGTVSFRTELYGDGAGGVPAWASTLFPAVGLVNSAGTFSVKSEAPGSNCKTVTIGVYEDGRFKSIRGAVGNAVFTFTPNKPVSIQWSFQGAWVTPTDVAMVAPTHPTRLPIRASMASLSIGATVPFFSSMTLDLGNVIASRETITEAGGLHSFIITDRFITGTLDPESKLVATSPIYTDWYNSVERALSVVVTDVNDEVTFSGPKFQITNAQEGDRNGLMIDTISYQLNRDANNDEFSIAFGAT